MFSLAAEAGTAYGFEVMSSSRSRNPQGVTVMQKISVPFGVLLGCILLCLFALPRQAGAVSHNFYEGKTIRIIWPFDPAGGGGVRARVFARHLPKWIPGHPSVIVQFMPGGGGLTAANHAFVVAKSDGLTILHFPASTLMHSFLSPDRVHYDIRKVPIIWTEPDNWMTIIDPTTTQVRSIKDLLRPGVRVAVGGTAVSSTSLRSDRSRENPDPGLQIDDR
jgi:tripartite-type tricarboxylate transporter receptor subunit TctC